MNDRFRIDGEKLSLHPERVVQWRAADTWDLAREVFPVYVEVSPVGACNHRCTFCAVDYIGYKNTQLESTRMFDVLKDMGTAGVKAVMFAGEGEPLLHKQINDMVLAAHYNGMDSAFTTNGVLLDKLRLEHISWVKISVNAGTKESYAKVHKTNPKDWDTVWKNIADAVQRKNGCTIGVQMVALPENEGEGEALQKQCDKAGVDYLVVKPYSQHKFSITREYEGYKPIQILRAPGVVVRDAAIETTDHNYKRCMATPNFWAYLMASGDLYSCSAYLLDDRFNLGNVNEQSFSEIWQGEKRRQNWEYVRNELDISECRVNCRMARVNEYLASLDTVEHRNFI